MNIEPSPNGPAVAPGLPTVQPPSGRHILQMFLVPGLIVSSIIAVVIAFTWLFGGPRTPEEWFARLRDPNPDIRWKAAADLAQYLLRDKDLSSDPQFALQLAGLLDESLRDSEAEEKALAERLAKVTGKEAQEKEWQKIQGEPNWKTIDSHRRTIMYLSASLGSFSVPVGVPLLKEIAVQTAGVEPRGLSERRWRAVFALAVLGQKWAKEYPALPNLRRNTIQAQLEKATQNKATEKWAGPALRAVKQREAGNADMMGLDVAFEKIADPASSDPFLRENVALALNFWTGTPEEDDRMDQLLLKLTHDTGAGGELLMEIASENPDGYTPGDVRGLLVAYNANIALANRGSRYVRIPMLADMLDSAYLHDRLKTKRKDGTESTDEALVVNTLLNTLKAVGTLHFRWPDLDLSALRPAIDTLAAHPNGAVQTEAKKLQKSLDAK